MSRINYKNAKAGMRVKLTHPDPGYDIGHSNPKAGTELECVGIIKTVAKSSFYVKWSNGYGNTYKDNELSLIDTGICIDMWAEM